ncbi:MAG: HAMP domain-containing protein [Betaproteobacteria bacterium]|nr:HAMP domain-containing protein [Betaproteobacteria bacterium]
MTSRRLRWQAALSTRGGRVLTGIVSLCGAVMVYLLSSASGNTPEFAGAIVWLLGAGVALVLILMILAGYQLLLLRRRLKQHLFGSKLTLRLVLTFALVAILPGVLVYAVSVQFITRSIDTWFDIRVEKALEGGLALGRNTLEFISRDLRDKAESMAVLLSDQPREKLRSTLYTLRDQAAVSEAALFDASGNVLFFSSQQKDALAPQMLTSEVLQNIRVQRPSSRFLADGAQGLLVRVVVPVNMRGGEVLALQVVQIVPDDITRNTDAVQSAYGEFQELMYSRPGLKQLYGLSLTLALLLALFGSLLLGIFFSERLSAPLGVLAEGTRAVAQGDFREREPVKSYDELRILTRSFNAMTRDLAEAQAASLRYQSEVEGAKNSLESILANLSAGVIALDEQRRPQSANPSASRILGVDFGRLGGLPLERWADVEPRLTAVAEPLRAALDATTAGVRETEIVFPGEHGDLTLLVKVSEISQPTGSEYVVVFDDITKLLRAQRQAAWGEVARRLAHEIKNPLTPIQLSAERLQHRLQEKLAPPEADMLGRLTRTIVNQVAALKGMVDAFSRYARSPEADLRPLDLGQLTREVMGLYESSGLAITVSVEPDLQPVMGDAAKLRQVIHNLVANAEDAVSSVTMPRVCVSVERANDAIALRVSDNGAGFPPELLGRPIEPYVTTKAKGTGLGLAIVERIVEEHGGSIHLENMVAGGARVSVVLPAFSRSGREFSRMKVVANG